ncbi:MAG TPA: hypothetical protein VMV71_01825 [Candidatus Paceibacterota bacterium]|nr:hypothetical protein [Candidatus Paceibacterota bacterium]
MTQGNGFVFSLPATPANSGSRGEPAVCNARAREGIKSGVLYCALFAAKIASKDSGKPYFYG